MIGLAELVELAPLLAGLAALFLASYWFLLRPCAPAPADAAFAAAGCVPERLLAARTWRCPESASAFE
jgi:hypothetical protein